MRPKRSLQHEFDMAERQRKAARLEEERRQAEQRSKKPGFAPYGILWSELDRRAMAFLTGDGRLCVWTRPDGSTRVYPPSDVQYRRVGDRYQVEIVDDADIDYAPRVSTLKIAIGRSMDGLMQIRHMTISDIPVNDYFNKTARRLARQDWADSEVNDVPRKTLKSP